MQCLSFCTNTTILLECKRHLSLLSLTEIASKYKGQGQIFNSVPVFSSADGLPALSFSISSLTLIGMLAVITYTVSLDLRQAANVVSCVQRGSICRVIKANHPMGSFPNLAFRSA